RAPREARADDEILAGLAVRRCGEVVGTRLALQCLQERDRLPARTIAKSLRALRRLRSSRATETSRHRKAHALSPPSSLGKEKDLDVLDGACPGIDATEDVRTKVLRLLAGVGLPGLEAHDV